METALQVSFVRRGLRINTGSRSPRLTILVQRASIVQQEAVLRSHVYPGLTTRGREFRRSRTAWRVYLDIIAPPTTLSLPLVLAQADIFVAMEAQWYA